MSEPVAARVEDETKRWLETRAEQEDITVSQLAGTILDSQSGDLDDAEPDSTEVRLNQIETDLKQRIAELEREVNLLVDHAENLENTQYNHIKICDDIELRSGTLDYPVLPGNDDGNTYGDGIRISPDSVKRNL